MFNLFVFIRTYKYAFFLSVLCLIRNDENRLDHATSYVMDYFIIKRKKDNIDQPLLALPSQRARRRKGIRYW
jgi:hypothetical protein